VKYVLVTEDSDRYTEKPKTELGTCIKGNKIRSLFECFLEKVYIIKKYDKVNNGIVKDINDFRHIFEEAPNARGFEFLVFDDYKRKPHAGYCGKIRPFDDLLFDIVKWKTQISGS